MAPPPATAVGARLNVEPREPTSLARPGIQPLGLGGDRDGLLYVPRKGVGVPSPLLVLLHGSGGSSQSWFRTRGFDDRAEAARMVLLAVDSRDFTWDIFVEGTFGPDCEFLSQAMAYAFRRCAIDPARMAIAGFSDGATYALSVGLNNGDVFPHVLSFSGGGLATLDWFGSPRVFMSHGVNDTVLPINSTTRPLATYLRAQGYDVTVEEFDGGHTLPAAIADKAFAWLSA